MALLDARENELCAHCRRIDFLDSPCSRIELKSKIKAEKAIQAVREQMKSSAPENPP